MPSSYDEAEVKWACMVNGEMKPKRLMGALPGALVCDERGWRDEVGAKASARWKRKGRPSAADSEKSERARRWTSGSRGAQRTRDSRLVGPRECAVAVDESSARLGADADEGSRPTEGELMRAGGR